MNNIFCLALANIRKNRGQAVSFIIITTIAALMLNLGLITAFEYPQSFDLKAKELSTPDVALTTLENNPDRIMEFEQKLEADERTVKAEAQPALVAKCDFDFNGSTQSRIGIMFNKDYVAKLGKWKIVETTEKTLPRAIYLPYLFQTGSGYQIGDSFEMSFMTPRVPKKTISFTVAGFYEDTFFSTVNNTTTGFILEKEVYCRLDEEFDGYLSGNIFTVKLRDSSEAEKFTAEYFQRMENTMPESQIMDSSYYEMVKSSRTITASIGAIIIVGFALILIIISLIVVKFRIGNSIEEEMQNIGVLEAIGYTKRQIIASFILQFVLLALIGFLFGIGAAYLLLSPLSMIFALQAGVLWHQQFSPTAMLITFLSLEIPVILVALLSLKQIKKLQPVTAMRFGVSTHSFRKNYIPLDKGKGSLIILLAVKQLLLNRKRNILVGIVIAGVTVTALFAGVLYYNISIKTERFLNFAVGNTEQVRLTALNEEAAGKLLEEAREKAQVREAIYYGEKKVTCEGEYESICYISDDFEKIDDMGWNYQGRFAEYDNELCLSGQLAKHLGKEIGEMVTLSLNGIEESYLITGFIQGSNYLGRDLCLTAAGYGRLQENFHPSIISVYLKEGSDTAAFIQEMEDTSENLSSALNREELVQSSLGIYAVVVQILAQVIAIVTIAIVFLVLYLVIKTVLNRQKRELAIQKAVGFTTWQLALQNACSFLPVITVGILAGCIGGYYGINPFLSVLFSSIGLMKVNFSIPFSLLVLVFAVIAFVGFATSLLVSMRIRKISPYSLLIE